MMATAKMLQTTTEQTRMGTNQSPMGDLWLFHQKRIDVHLEFRWQASPARGFGLCFVRSGRSTWGRSMADFDSGALARWARTLHEQSTYEAINADRRANSTSITVCP